MEGGGNGGSCDMCHITLKTLRTCTKCVRGGRSMLVEGQPMLALHALCCVGFQMGLMKPNLKL